MQGKIALMFLKEIGMMIIRKIDWDAVVERLASRAVMWGMGKLKRLDTNDVSGKDEKAVLSVLKDKKLKVIDSE